MIELSGETSEDKANLLSGLAKEVATGDPEFDRLVYVDSESEASVIKEVLTADVRAAVLAVLRQRTGPFGPQSVIIDDVSGRVSATWTLYGRGHARPDSAGIAQIVASFEVLVTAIPELAAAESQRSAFNRRASVVLKYLSFPMVAAAVAVRAYAPARMLGLLWVGAAVGALISVALVAACLALIRGRSGSPELRARALVASIWVPPSLGIIVARFFG